MPEKGLTSLGFFGMIQVAHLLRSRMMQALQSPKRYRGFRLTTAGWHKLQARLQQIEGQTQVRQNARAIAERVQLTATEGIHPITVRKILQGQQGVDRRSIEQVFEALDLRLTEGDCAHASLPQDAPDPSFLPGLAVAPPPDESQKVIVFRDASQQMTFIETEDGYCIIVSKSIDLSEFV